MVVMNGGTIGQYVSSIVRRRMGVSGKERASHRIYLPVQCCVTTPRYEAEDGSIAKEASRIFPRSK